MRIETERMIITEFDLTMAESVHRNSLDEDNRRFVPDEVFETIEDAKETIEFLMSVYETVEGPLVYPVLLKDGTNIGYVQLVPLQEGFEVGYHIGKEYTNKGYATEALKAFLEEIMPAKQVDIVYGICLSENIASKKVLEKTGFKKIYEGTGEYQGESRTIAKYVFNREEFENGCKQCAIHCVGAETLMQYQKQFRDCNGDFDLLFSCDTGDEDFYRRVIEPGHIYETGYPRCICWKSEDEQKGCECSRQALIFLYSQLLPDKEIAVETIRTVRTGAESCAFRIVLK